MKDKMRLKKATKVVTKMLGRKPDASSSTRNVWQVSTFGPGSDKENYAIFVGIDPRVKGAFHADVAMLTDDCDQVVRDEIYEDLMTKLAKAFGGKLYMFKPELPSIH